MKPVLRLDYQHWNSGTQEQRREFVEQIIESFQTTGYVKLVNHGFNEKQINECFALSRKFFDQPLEKKKEIISTTNPVRGYKTTGSETTSFLAMGPEGRETKDEKESLDMGSKKDKEFPNKWPRGLPGFKPFMESFYDQCETMCVSLIKALEVGLKVREGTIGERCFPSDTDFRLTNYPAIPKADVASGRKIRIASHVDFGFISLLWQDGVGGLEIEDRDKEGQGVFVPMPPTSQTEMIVNLGETLQRWTNDSLFGGLHRVAAPEAMKGSDVAADAIIPRRLSLAYLCKAQKYQSVGPLPAFVSEKNPAKYPEITGLEHHKVRNAQFY